MKLNEERVFKSIPILVIKIDGVYRAQISDRYEKYKPTKLKDINFEDLAFHFGEVHSYEFDTQKKALESAREMSAILKEKGLKTRVWIAS